MPRRLIFFAMPGEASAFFKRAVSAGIRFVPAASPVAGAVRKTAGDDEVWVTGVGPANARRVGEVALGSFNPDFVLTCGVAGALNPAHPVGAVFHDADREFSLAGQLLSGGSRPGKIVTRDFIAVTRAGKAALFQETGADLVEMESEVVRRLAFGRAIPSATVRGVSDTAAGDLPLDFNRVYSADMRLDPLKLALQIARRPWKIPGLIRLGGDAARASDSVARILIHTLYDGPANR